MSHPEGNGAVKMDVKEGDQLWSPSADRIDTAELTKFMRWLAQMRGLSFANYDALWEWSVDDPEGFWSAIWDYFEIIADKRPDKFLIGNEIFDARWFVGVRSNYAEHILRHEAEAEPGETALCHSSEIRPISEMSWQDLGGGVRKLATQMRAMGIVPGDRVVSYMPNTPEAVIAMLATVAIGAVWSSAAPEFGFKTVVDRFSQIEPKLAFVSDGYSFNGKAFDRRKDVSEIVNALDSLKHVVWFGYMGLGCTLMTDAEVAFFGTMFDGPSVPRESFQYERVPEDHPLWILYSSGTTGLPKAIVHSHAGMIAEHLKVMVLHCNLGPSKRMFFYTTTGWMMWNSVISALITGASAVLYDGSPVHGGIDMLWRMAADTRTTCFGASPTLVDNMKKAGVSPGKSFDLSAMDMVLLGGAPATPETFNWFYENVAEDFWVNSQSGGTDLCSGLAVGLPTEPVYAGEIQCRGLGIALEVWDESGCSIVDEVGELVVTRPFPTAPLGFWGDDDRARYYESYFGTFPGIWRHGDLAKINSRGGIYVYGRSDSTLNRFGVRIGTAEIYRILERIPGVSDSLIIGVETDGGGFYMPLFVSLDADTALTEELKKEIVSRLRVDASPRHVPDEIHAVPEIPYTLTGKKMEVPIRKLVMGMEVDQVVSRDAMAKPGALDWFVEFVGRRSSL
jgi:acetoacetyl-CoA synthetase